MATFIEKNTTKLKEHALNKMFARQQKLNGDAGGSGKLPKAYAGWEQDGKRNSMNNPFQLQDITVTGQRKSQTYGFDPGYGYTAPQIYDTVDNSLSYGTNEARRNAPGPTFSNPLDDPNSKLFDPALSKANTLKAAGINKPNWGKVGTFAMQAAPMLYNMFKGLQRPDKVTPNYNPYEGDIRNAMRNRRFNVDPTLNANRVAQAVSNRNIRSAANSRGELMGNLGAAQNYRMAGDAAAYAQKNNMDNQYLGEQAQMDAQLGSQRAQMDWATQTAQAQNDAATDQFMGQGFNDLGEFSQVQQQMNNQRFRDAQLAGLYPDMYSQIYQFQPFMQEIVKGAKREGGLS